jgi:membrane fusion protein (multidrug efflux system)
VAAPVPRPRWAWWWPPTDVGLVTELPGRLEASRVAQVRARAAGILLKREFREGSDVKAGQLLFRIDPAPLVAASQNAQATLARAEANAVQAKALADRYKPLVEANAVSKQEYATAVASQKTAEADVAAGRAAVQTAKINLGYADVTSPIAGRIGRALVTEGALVGQGDATELAVVQQINPVYVNFTQSASDVLKLRRAWPTASTSARAAAKPPASAWCWKTAATTRWKASCCSPTSRSTPPPARSRCAPKCPTPRASCCPACMCA